jgi:phosphatidate cytidylyltransferase
VSDDVWRTEGDDAKEEDDWGFDDPLFADDQAAPSADAPDAPGAPGGEAGDEPPLRLGPDDTGQQLHWTEPPTGEVPRIFSEKDPTDDLDVWSSFGQQQPVWRDERGSADDPTRVDDLTTFGDMPKVGALDESPAPDDPFFDVEPDAEPATSAPTPRAKGPIQIGTDPTDEPPMPPPPRVRASDRDPRRPPTGQTGRVREGRPPNAGGNPTGDTRRRPSDGGRVPPGSTPGRDMPVAIAAGLALAVVFIALLKFAGTTGVMVLVVIVTGLGAIEFYDKAAERGYRPASVIGIAACALMPLAAYWQGEAAIVLVSALAFAATVIVAMSYDGVQSGPLPNTAITMLGVVWVGVLGSFAALILQYGEPIGTDTIFYVAIAVVATDVGALAVGSTAGRTPLRGWISPNKTVEGLIGGVVATILVLILVKIVNDKAQTWNSLGEVVLLAIVVALAAPIGDLTESMFKRNLDIKDFGTIVPGHGGVLDRFDAFLFALPAAYYLLVVLQPWTS